MSATAPQSQPEPLLQIRNLKKHFPVKKGVFNRVVGSVKAVDGLSFDVYPNETLGLVGESGCGKTTAGRSLLRLLEPTDGQIIYDNADIVDATPDQMRRLRRQLQIIFQDPYSSLNPRMTVEDIIGEAIGFHGLAKGDKAIRSRVQDLLERVGLQPSYVTRYPHEFSGGQRQRIGVARALALNPDFIVCDEAVSALDVSVQAQVVNLLLDLQTEFNLSYLFIAHDLAIVRHISDRIAVMYLGKIMELAECETLFGGSLHPYTQALLSAIPEPNPRKRVDRVILKGDVPSPMDPPKGCRFHTRCPAAYEPCSEQPPKSTEVSPGHTVACHLYDKDHTTTQKSVWKRMPRVPTEDEITVLPERIRKVIRQLTGQDGSTAKRSAPSQTSATNDHSDDSPDDAKSPTTDNSTSAEPTDEA